MYYLYKVVNNINSKVYIGVTKNPRRRFNRHCNPNTSSIIAKAIQKYRRENFSFILLCFGEKEYILDLEVKLIKAYNSTNRNLGYNRSEGGEGSTTDYLNDIRSNDRPIFLKGFWFPSIRLARFKLNIPENVTIKRLKPDPLIGDILPKKGTPEYTEKRKKSSKGMNKGENNGMFGKTGKLHPNSRAVVIEGVFYHSISDAVRQTAYTKSQIEKRLKAKHPNFKYYDELCYELKES